MSQLAKQTCEITTDFTTGDAQSVITVESSPPAMPMAWVNYLKQRLHVLQLDYKQVTADRIVVASRPEAAESVARLLRSAVECADHYVTGARNAAPLRNAQDVSAQFGDP